MGVFEDLMAKMDEHIVALNKNTEARLAEAAGAGAAATGDAPKRGRPKKEEVAAAAPPKTTEEALVKKFDELKAVDTEKRLPELRKIIADLGFASLKELRVTPTKFDEAMDALTAYEATLGQAADEDDDL